MWLNIAFFTSFSAILHCNTKKLSTSRAIKRYSWCYTHKACVVVRRTAPQQIFPYITVWTPPRAGSVPPRRPSTAVFLSFCSISLALCCACCRSSRCEKERSCGRAVLDTFLQKVMTLAAVLVGYWYEINFTTNFPSKRNLTQKHTVAQNWWVCHRGVWQQLIIPHWKASLQYQPPHKPYVKRPTLGVIHSVQSVSHCVHSAIQTRCCNCVQQKQNVLFVNSETNGTFGKYIFRW